MKQSFENIDWEAEALRVAKAFGVEGEFAFVDGRKRSSSEAREKRFYKAVKNVFNQWPYSNTGKEVQIIYHPEGNEFGLHCKPEPGCLPDGMWIKLMPDGSLRFHEFYIEERVVNELAHALYRLDLYSPEIEAALKVKISMTEKIEEAKDPKEE